MPSTRADRRPNHAMERTSVRRALHLLDDFHTSTPSNARSRPPSLILFSLDLMKTGLPLLLFWIAAFLMSASSATARPYSDAELKAMFLRMPNPDYPYQARVRKEEGIGLFRLHVDERGKVTSVTVLRSTGHPALDAEGLKALEGWLARSGERRDVDVPLRFLLSGTKIDNGMGKDGLGVMKSRDR